MTTLFKKYSLRSRSTEEDISQVALQLEETTHQSVPTFQIPDNIMFNAEDMVLFAHLEAHMLEDIPIYYYFPEGTRASERTFVFNTLILYCDWRNPRQYNALVNCSKQQLTRVTSGAGSSNKTASDPFKQQFGSMSSFCSALIYISRKKDRWPIAQRNQPKFYMRIGNSNDFFPFTG